MGTVTPGSELKQLPNTQKGSDSGMCRVSREKDKELKREKWMKREVEKELMVSGWHIKLVDSNRGQRDSPSSVQSIHNYKSRC